MYRNKLAVLLIGVLNLVCALASTPPVEFLGQTIPFSALKDAKYKEVLSLFPDTNEKKLLEVLFNSSHRHDDEHNGADLRLTALAWHLTELEYRKFMLEKVAKVTPLIKELLGTANATEPCRTAVDHWLHRLAQTDLWAHRMWNAWGDFPPSGFFEGSISDYGSYDGCLNSGKNDFIGEPQYCTLDFQPIVPPRPRFLSVFKRVLDVDESGRLNQADFRHNDGPIGPKITSHSFPSSWYAQNLTSRDWMGANMTKWLSSFKITSSAIMKPYLLRGHAFYYVKFRIGSCWPSHCTRTDVKRITQTAASRALLQTTSVRCLTESEARSPQINGHQWAAIAILALLTSLSVLATLIDAIQITFGCCDQEPSRGFLWTYVDAYSLIRNSRRLFSIPKRTKKDSKEVAVGRANETRRQLECLNGLRVISMVSIIYGHSILNTEYELFSHGLYTVDTHLGNFFYQAGFNSNFHVDTFFVISGLLSAYIVFSVKQKFSGALYIFLRYVRLTPQVLIVMLMFFLIPLLGEGPIFRNGFLDQEVGRCFKNWWMNLTYLQCYVDRPNLCMVPLWWISIDMTFQVMSVGIIYILIKYPGKGLLANFGLVGIMNAIGFTYHYIHGYAIQYLPSIPQRFEVEHEQTQNFFHRPYPHAASYFIGLALGYALAKRWVRHLSRLQLWVGWIVCSFGIFLPLCGSYRWNLGLPYSQLEASLYYFLYQNWWPCAIAWVILACSLGQGGFVNSFLSAKFFIPFARITYMTYLSHIIIVYYYPAVTQQTVYPNSIYWVYLSLGNVVISLIFGTLVSLLFEGPILHLQKSLLLNYLVNRQPRVNDTPDGITYYMTKVIPAKPKELHEGDSPMRRDRHSENNK